MSTEQTLPARRAPKKSTNVRFVDRLTIGGISLLSHLAPGPVGRWAGATFFKPKRIRMRGPRVPGIEARSGDVWLDDRRLRVWSWGEGPAVLLSHGWESCAAHWEAWIVPLVRAGFRVVAFDQPAHGESDGIRTNAIEMGRAVAAVARGFGPVHGLVGHSVGGTAAMGATLGVRLDAPITPRALVLLAPVAAVDVALGIVERALALSPRARRAFRGYAERSVGFPVAHVDVAHWVQRVDPLPPLLVQHDVDDREIPLSSGRRVVEHWTGAQFVETQGLGHRRIMRDAEVITRSVDFLVARLVDDEVVSQPERGEGLGETGRP